MKKLVSLILSLVLCFSLSACTSTKSETSEVSQETKSTGIAYLYGEAHGEPVILEKEFELWNNYYHENGMRHLFVELPYYSAEYLNLWMSEDDNDILDEFFNDIQGTAIDTKETKEFFINIKESCPETIFHGIDVGHQYHSTGARYLEYLNENNMQDSEAFTLTNEAIAQGEQYYSSGNAEYRENMLVENFKREFDKLKNQDIMGIFGAFHTDFNTYVSENTPNMTIQLIEYYGENIIAESLTYLTLRTKPISTETLTINNKEYKADYYGEQDLSALFPDYSVRKFWKLPYAIRNKQCVSYRIHMERWQC